MIVADQAEVLGFLSEPDAYPASAGSVERIDTHAAAVFLAGDRAYKLKRAVRYDYLDYSTVALRQTACEREVAINRATAPDVYLGALPVTRRPDGTLSIDGDGPAIDWLVVMRRFDQNDLLDRMAESGRLSISSMAALAASIAAMHEGAERTPDFGGRAGMRDIVDGNAEAFAEHASTIPRPLAALVTGTCRSAIDTWGDLLDQRREAGFVRRCHGDLHLRNIVMLGGRPSPFDAIEFNDTIACGDVLYDLAFLVMDLWYRAMPLHANRLVNAYLDHTEDDNGLPLLPLFLGCRAAIRAKTSATAAAMAADAEARTSLGRNALAYLELAAALLETRAPMLVAVGGLSGTGKSTLAARLAPSLGRPPGAIVVRSDLVRKAMFGQRPETPLGPPAYAPEVGRAVYTRLEARAARILASGQAVVLDAVFADPAARAAVETVARTAGARFAGIWLEAPEHVLVDRVITRVRDVSDATPDVVRRQLAAGPGEVSWTRIDGSGPPEHTERLAQSVLSDAASGGTGRSQTWLPPVM